ncbi:DUF4231 domain-containing protein [Flammeovirgaceae bacterium SG7u.111]|nr:DUF4231 domain-containing protein [Flammeovirgaceae bacterium SG7u.132]WPO34289.1 DUF4231 domain-containing protein [Flammeovirgaceae bacterium SG7u.111]
MEEEKVKKTVEDRATEIAMEEGLPLPKKKGEAEKAEPEEIEVQEESTSSDKKDFSGEHRNYKPLGRTMPLMTDEEYITNRLDDQMNWFDRKSSLNQKRYKKYKRIEFIIAATIPVLTTMTAVAKGYDNSETIETVMLVSAALGGIVLVILNKFLELGDFFKYWKEYRAAAEALQYERALYLTRTEPYDEEDAFPKLVEKVESILSKETQKWQTRMKQPQHTDFSNLANKKGAPTTSHPAPKV